MVLEWLRERNSNHHGNCCFYVVKYLQQLIGIYTVYSKKQNKASFPNSFYVSYNEPYEKNFSTK